MKAFGWVLAPFLLYVGCVALLGDWIIDDAGISFAYARSVAHGDGFVSQPGRVPVEGFSNFLWVLATVPFFWLHVFDPIWLPKVVGALLVLATSVVVARTLREASGKRWPGWLAVPFLVTAPPIVIWTASGLENSLLLFLVVSAWATGTLRPRRWELAGGALSALAAMTRPEGLVFALALPLVSLAELASKRNTPKRALGEAGRALAGFGAVWLPFFAFRLWRFGLPLPHPYYAKTEHSSQGERFFALFAEWGRELRGKLIGLGEAFAGPVGPWLLFGALVAFGVLARKRRVPRAAGTALAFLALASFAYVWLPNDWMGEFRFATPVVAMAWIFFASLAPELFELVPAAARRRSIVIGVSLAGGAAVALPGFSRLVRFAENPPTPYASVERRYAKRFDAFARALGVTKGSILIADAGATLFESGLTVYDTAGLTEPAVVRTLRQGTHVWRYDHPLFYDWVLGEIRPTFVVTHAFWSNVTTLEYDPRFVRDYVAIDAFPDAYVKSVFGRDVHSGEFVRRDALRMPGALEAMRKSYVFPPQPEPLVVRIGDRLRAWRFGPPSTDELRREAELAASPPKPNPDRAAALYRRVVNADPADHQALERLGRALDQAGRSGEAHAEWQRVAELAEKNGDGAALARARARLSDPFATNAQAFFTLGLREAAEKRLDAAVIAYRRCVEIDPRHADALNNLGFTLGVLGRYSEAIPPLEEAVRLRPDPLARANLEWVKRELEKKTTPPLAPLR